MNNVIYLDNVKNDEIKKGLILLDDALGHWMRIDNSEKEQIITSMIYNALKIGELFFNERNKKDEDNEC